MANQHNNTQFFTQAKPLSIRIWHWVTFLFFLASISTVIFGSTLYKTRNNISLVQEQIASKGGTVTKDQARAVAHEFSDKLWMLHKYIGFGLSILVLLRIIIEITNSKEDRLMYRIKSASSIKVQSAEKSHYLFVNYSYLVFYILFLVMALTGLVLAFEDFTWLDGVHKISKQIHSIVQYGLYAYMLMHIAGVVRADSTKYGGIISRMVNGKNQ